MLIQPRLAGLVCLKLLWLPLRPTLRPFPDDAQLPRPMRASSRRRLPCKARYPRLGTSTSVTPKSSSPRRGCPCTSSALFPESRRRLWAAQPLRSCLHRRLLDAPELSSMDAWARCPVPVCTLYRLLHQLRTQTTPLEVDA